MAAALLRLRGGESAIVDSAGVYEGGLDPFVEIVMCELGVSLADHEPKTLGEVDLSKWTVVIALSAEAAAAARKLEPTRKVEFWDIENPSEERGGRDAVIDAYRRVRDCLAARLEERFPEIWKKP